MTIDLIRARAETPGAEKVLHFNNAGAALPPAPVLDAMLGHLRREAEVGGYEAADEAEARREAVYGSIARLIGAAPDEIALVESATRGWDMAAYALPLTPGDRILTGRAEYSSNLYGLLQIARRSGAHIDIIPDDENGTIDCAMLQARLDGSAKLIALTHIPTNNGLVNPAAEVGRIARAAGIPYLLDACQSIGQMPVDVAAIGCDMLAATGRKFLRAPRGTGFLYVRREWIERLEPPLIDNHAAAQGSDGSYVLRGDARRFEAWEHSPAARLGLGAAADYALGWGLDAIRERTFALAATLRSHLADLPGISVLDRGIERCGIVTFASAREGAEALHARLRARGIHCSLTDPAPAALSPAAPSKALRASVHYYNSEAEVAAFVAAVSSAPISA